MWKGRVEELIKCLELSKESRERVVAFIRNHDMKILASGRYELSADDYVNIFEYDTKENDGVFEAHKEYIDIHYAIIGNEKILWADNYDSETKPYQAEGDYSLGTVNNSKSVELNDELLLLSINEPHKAGILIDEIVRVKKAVFKIKVN